MGHLLFVGEEGRWVVEIKVSITFQMLKCCAISRTIVMEMELSDCDIGQNSFLQHVTHKIFYVYGLEKFVTFLTKQKFTETFY